MSADSWIEVGRKHPEFVRIYSEDSHQSVSLVARFAHKIGNEQPPALNSSSVEPLMKLAVDLHDREIQRRDWWLTSMTPMVVASIAAMASIIAAFIATGFFGRFWTPP